ncbi:hypothetical protein C5167_042090 [Papaver somniferum]|nr:hypothetical protein C5167_042090 [Papaver somniferum]
MENVHFPRQNSKAPQARQIHELTLQHIRWWLVIYRSSGTNSNGHHRCGDRYVKESLVSLIYDVVAEY